MTYKKTINAYDVDSFTGMIANLAAAVRWLDCQIISVDIDPDRVQIHIPPDAFMDRFSIYGEYMSGTLGHQSMHYTTTLADFDDVKVIAVHLLRGDA